MPFPNDFSARLAGGFDLDEPHTCTPGAAGCGWTNGDMATFNQDDWGVGAGAAGLLLVANYDAIYASTFNVVAQILGTMSLRALVGLVPRFDVPTGLSARIQAAVKLAPDRSADIPVESLISGVLNGANFVRWN